MTRLTLDGAHLVRRYSVEEAPSFMYQAQEMRPYECTLTWTGQRWTAVVFCRGVSRADRNNDVVLHFDAGYKPVAMPTWLNNLILDTSPGGVS